MTPAPLVILTVTCAWCRQRSADLLRPIAYEHIDAIAHWPACAWHSDAETCPVCDDMPDECDCSCEELWMRMMVLPVCLPAV
jgi:hypothetical protein